MRIRKSFVIPAGVVLASASLVSGGVSANAAPAELNPRDVVRTVGAHHIPSVLEQRQFALRQEAIQRRISGDPSAQGDVIRVGKAPKGGPAGAAADDGSGVSNKSQYVEYAREGVSRIFALLAEYGNDVDPRYGTYEEDGTAIEGYDKPGPLHNQIAQPDRSEDNATIWSPDYDVEHYDELYFGDTEGTDRTSSVKHFFDRQSSGRFTFDGEIADWVKVRYNGASYGSDYCGDIVCHNVWNLVIEAADEYVQSQRAAGRTLAQIKSRLQQYDIEDRYDYDADGVFDEPDGYLDHFQILHAGEDEAAGGGKNPNLGDYGENAIWSHKWYVNDDQVGESGPSFNKLGGTQIGDTGIWIGDYTIQPENAGVGVIAHETAHDLGLPDEYDTSGEGESSAAFWTLMSSGSYLSGEGDEGGPAIGTRPGILTAWAKLQLGWLDYTAVGPGDAAKTVQLGPSQSANKVGPQALVVELPEKDVTFTYPKPYAGTVEWFSSSGNNVNSSMTRTFDLRRWKKATATAKVNYETEKGYDFVYTEVSTDGGETFKKVTPSVAGEAKPDGIDGSTEGAWVDYALDLTPYAGEVVKLRIRYQTDGGVAKQGFFLDNFAVTTGNGTVLYRSGAEAGNDGWALSGGWRRTTGSETKPFAHYYIAETRSYQSFDDTLAAGPYNFGFLNTHPNRVEHFRYMQGLLVSYWDTSFEDNNTGEHPGEGLILPVDSRPQPLLRPDGTPWRTRVQVYDATFGLRWASKMTLHVNGVPSYIFAKPPVPTFDDSKSYWTEAKPDSSVKVPHTGTQITVQSQDDPTLGSMKVWVQPPS